MTVAPIPTTYAGGRYRSRLEARWAAFFDLAGLPYIYEPIDAGGYIPDFLIPGAHPLYVEVGPVTTLEEYRAKAEKPKAANIGEFIVLGTDPLARGLPQGWPLVIGLQYQWFEAYEDSPAGYDDGNTATISVCEHCSATAIVNMVQSYQKYPCGHHDDHWGDAKPDAITALWRQAGALTQWNPR